MLMDDDRRGITHAIDYRRGHADGMKEALKAVRAVMELSAKHWVGRPPEWHRGIEGIIDVCTMMLEGDTKDIEELHRRLYGYVGNETTPIADGVPDTANANGNDLARGV